MGKKANRKPDGRMPLTVSVPSKGALEEKAQESARRAKEEERAALKASLGKMLFCGVLTEEPSQADSVPLDDPFEEKMRLRRLVEKRDAELTNDLFSGCERAEPITAASLGRVLLTRALTGEVVEEEAEE